MNKQKYIQIRSVYSDFVYKILKADKDARKNMIEAGKRLGFWSGEVMEFEGEEESSVLMDYLLYEKVFKSKRLIDQYESEKHQITTDEEKILNGMIDNHDSLFEVLSINKEKSMIKLLDLITKEEHEFMDIAFSKSNITSLLIYTRLVPIDDIYMTSGVSFCFHPTNKLSLLTVISGSKLKSSASRRKKNYKHKNRKRALLEKMLKCNRQFGMEVTTIEQRN